MNTKTDIWDSYPIIKNTYFVYLRICYVVDKEVISILMHSVCYT